MLHTCIDTNGTRGKVVVDKSVKKKQWYETLKHERWLEHTSHGAMCPETFITSYFSPFRADQWSTE